jgi:hypothetical protein
MLYTTGSSSELAVEDEGGLHVELVQGQTMGGCRHCQRGSEELLATSRAL